MFLKEKTINLRKINKGCELVVLGSKNLGDHLANEDTQNLLLVMQVQSKLTMSCNLTQSKCPKKSIMPEM